MHDPNDTIAAISSAAGAAPRAILRLSGPAAIDVAARLLTDGQTLAELTGFRWADVIINLPDPPQLQLPARAYLFRTPRSYTRQDLVELHLPGSPALATACLQAALAAGARQAEPGEFTARAFFSGRLDLSQAEAVADIINAEDATHLKAALASLGGQVHRLCEKTSSRLADALATVEASIDLAEEDIQLQPPADLAAACRGVAEELRTAAESAGDMPDTAAVPNVVLAGQPNVGKSSLLNALSGTPRAIISAMAGTTRDVLSATVTLADGASIRLLDAAGFGTTADPLAPHATQAARAAVSCADAVLLVVDPSQDSPHARDADRALLADVVDANPRAPKLLILNKCDIVPTSEADLGNIARKIDPEKTTLRETLAISAVTGEGLDALRAVLAEVLDLAAERPGAAMGLHNRQRQCLLNAASAADAAAELCLPAADLADVAELAAVELRAALAAVGAVSGDVVTDDILGRIFARFCVGK